MAERSTVEGSWFVRSSGRVRGPTSEAELRLEIENGLLAADTELSPTGQSDWVPLGMVAEFAPHTSTEGTRHAQAGAGEVLPDPKGTRSLRTLRSETAFKAVAGYWALETILIFLVASAQGEAKWALLFCGFNLLCLYGYFKGIELAVHYAMIRSCVFIFLSMRAMGDTKQSQLAYPVVFIIMQLVFMFFMSKSQAYFRSQNIKASKQSNNTHDAERRS